MHVEIRIIQCNPKDLAVESLSEFSVNLFLPGVSCTGCNYYKKISISSISHSDITNITMTNGGLVFTILLFVLTVSEAFQKYHYH